MQIWEGDLILIASIERKHIGVIGVIMKLFLLAIINAYTHYEIIVGHYEGYHPFCFS